MSKKFVLIACGTLMSAQVWAQSGGGMAVDVARTMRRGSPLDTMRAMLQRRNPTVDEVIAWSAEVSKRAEEVKVFNEKAQREMPGATSDRLLQLKLQTMETVVELQQAQRILFEACNAIRPHQGESKGVLGFQIEKGTNFQNKTPVVKEERFVRTPEIVFVEPNTPAAKADIRVGDVWMAIAGRELVNTYVRDLNDVLTPGNRVDLKILRDGREVKVEVMARQRREFPEEACSEQKLQISMTGPGMPRIQLFNGPVSPETRDFFTMKILRATFSGAVFTELTDAKRERLKVPAGETGAVVESVVPGSAADIAGLHDLDVVTRANNEVIESVTDLMKILQSGRQVTLWVWDGAKGRGVTLPAR
jgi:hypothetical protein